MLVIYDWLMMIDVVNDGWWELFANEIYELMVDDNDDVVYDEWWWLSGNG